MSSPAEKHSKKEKPLTKVIVRRLPPALDQQTFLKQISPIPDYDYIYLGNGDLSLGENAFSRVYINFVNYEDVYNFKERFDNYVFLDDKGSEYPCVVEFAPFQEIPKKWNKSRTDPRAGSIDSDRYYLDFLESLKNPQKFKEKPEFTFQLATTETNNEKTTPLLEYVKNRRVYRMKIRESRKEERKRREFVKRSEQNVDGDKNLEEKSSNETNTTSGKSGLEAKIEKEERYYEKAFYKKKDKRYDDRKKESKPKYFKKEYSEFKGDKHEEKKYEPKTFTRRVKKYSELVEERKKKEEAKSKEKQSESTRSKHPENFLKNLEKPEEKIVKTILKEKDSEQLTLQDNLSSKEIEKVEKI